MTKTNFNLLIFSVIILAFGVRLELVELFAVQTPYWDDWGIGGFVTRVHLHGVELADFFRHANEHRLTFNRLWSIALFNMNNEQWDPIVWMLSNAMIWAVSGAILVAIVQKHAPSHKLMLTIFIAILWSVPFSLVNVLWGIQTHTYTMILFSILGCWWVTDRVFSVKWVLGLLCLAAATLTLAGGTFASVGVVGVSLLVFVAAHKSTERKSYLITAVAATLPAALGLALIASLPERAPQEIEIADSLVTFLKTMSWPEVNEIYHAFIYAAPVIILIVQIFKQGITPSRFTRFALSLFAFIAVIALAVAYARGSGGIGPARRYFEYLALVPLASLMALSAISYGVYRVNTNLVATLFALFITAFIAGMPMQMKAIDYTLKERNALKPIQTHVTSRYLNTGDPDELYGHPHRHAPFPHIETFQGILDEMSAADTLPSSLQPQPDLQWNPEINEVDRAKSAFIRNGTNIEIDEVIGSDHLGEPAYGSFNPDQGGEAATGTFESATVRITRSYADISYMGDIDGPGMSLLLEDVGSGEQFLVKPNNYQSRYSRKYNSNVWTNTYLKIPRGYYKIVAQDNSEDSWLAFGSPRSVGRLSFYAQSLKGHRHWIWKIAILIMLFSLRDSFRNLVLPRQQNA